MASGLLAAAGASMRAFGSRRASAEIAPSVVSWGHALIGVVLLLVVVAATEVLPLGIAVPQLLPALFQLLLVSLVVHAVPFVVLVVAAIWSRQREKLPLLVLFTALALVLIQLTIFVLSLFGLRSEAALVGVTAYLVGRASRTILGYSIPAAVLVGLIVAVAIIAASFLFLALPGGQEMSGQP